VDLGQALQNKGFNCSIISVDRLTSAGPDTKTKVCIPYQTFRNAVYEGRLMVYPTKLLTAEVVGLVRDGNGKVDHSPAGINSKDTVDSLCGALYDASLHSEEYEYNYGDSLEQLLTVNADSNYDDPKQLSLNLENELIAMYGQRAIKGNEKPQRVHPSDANKPTDNFTLYNDIIIL
jgi:hypothetical protein